MCIYIIYMYIYIISSSIVTVVYNRKVWDFGPDGYRCLMGDMCTTDRCLR